MDIVAHRKSYTRKEFLRSFTDMSVILAQVFVWSVTKLEQVVQKTRKKSKMVKDE